MALKCTECGNEAEDPEEGMFVQNNSTGTWRCTRCGSYSTIVKNPATPEEHLRAAADSLNDARTDIGRAMAATDDDDIGGLVAHCENMVGHQESLLKSAAHAIEEDNVPEVEYPE